MERQLDGEAAALLAQAVEARGVEVVLSAQTQAILGAAQCEGVLLADGRTFAADLAVLAAGVRPNADLARACGLETGRGIVVDDGLATSDPDIFAIGDCAEHRGTCYGLVEPAYRQADVLAARLAGRDAAYGGSTVATNLKVSGVNVFSAGDHLGAGGGRTIVHRDRGLGTYRKLVVRDDRLAGAVLFGDTTDAPWYLDLLRSGARIGAMRAGLIFGRAVAERSAMPAAA
jgi:nitrite reductase (NADH) large subunit